ncbi:MAG: 4-hydroxythreonine-4-phosphate dehydrogenase PdxA [Bacteroidia bacterium]|nr:4-hydroxythreonine-4-phosphate dehydrogenase PdxA [Bacteroidia bacterium]MCZ2278120.1 4-hydroxythreonine-4-phosphate dehydrogenase PdxA [Bacteroidia bacterium]
MSQNEAEEKLRVGISIGDINSISHELIFKTFSDHNMLHVCTPVVYSSAKAWAFHRKALGNPEIQYQTIAQRSELNTKKLNLVNCWDEEVKIEFGPGNSFTGKYAVLALKKSLDDLNDGYIDVLVTCPLDKHAVEKTTPGFNGHTNFIASYLKTGTPLMMFLSDVIKVICVTGHVSLKNAVGSLTQDLIKNQIRQAIRSLNNDFGIIKPRIAVLGLNPHASDQGLMGNEEKEIIEPAIRSLTDEHAIILGPYPADGFFGHKLNKKFDLVVAMYHDQGLIPFKALFHANGVNYTAGLPIIRTSPVHGTGADIAGKNKADESSFRSAIYSAIDIQASRKLNKELMANPLKVSTQDSEK